MLVSSCLKWLQQIMYTMLAMAEKRYLAQAEAREAARKLQDSQRQLAETRADEQAARARLEADMAALKSSRVPKRSIRLVTNSAGWPSNI